ncbi:MAG: IS66 family transposase, partial [Myxococcales bacterium]|nr:IS66 family transposase [Myxococcales bacterium]
DKAGVLSVIERLELEIKKLQLDLAKLKQGSGRHSEGLTQKQLALLFDELAAQRNALAGSDDAEGVVDVEGRRDDTLTGVGSLDTDLAQQAKSPRKPPTGPKRRELPASLPRVDNPLPVPESKRCCPCCEAPMTALEPEVHEVLDYQPGHLFVRRDIREVLACRAQDCAVVRGPLGDKVVAGGVYGSALISEIVVKKYRDGMSLHRIGQWLERMGFSIASSSLADQVQWAADLLAPVWRALLHEVLHSTVMQLDGTGLPVHHKEKGKPQLTRLGSLWGVVGDGETIAFSYASTAHKNAVRSYDLGPEDLLALRPGGFVVADADSKFDASFQREELIESGCAMHSRRYFVSALDAGNKRAAIVLKAFKKLYRLEWRFAEDGLSVAEIEKARQARAGPVWETLKMWCEGECREKHPSSLLVIGAKYLLRHYDALTRYLTDGRLPIDNGLVERLFRRVAVVRKNALFVGSHDGGRRAAVLFSILGTCELIGLEPVAYLSDVLPKLARGITIATDMPDLMPAAWLARHPEASVPRLNVPRLTEFQDD